MKLLNEIVKTENDYLYRLAQIQEQVEIWIKDIAREKRLGLPPIDQMVEANGDPYNSADKPTGLQPSDTVEFKPTNAQVEKPTNNQPVSGSSETMRIHLIYDPRIGEVVSSMKTPVLSRPPSAYVEANASQVHGALKHLEKMNPKLADLLVAGRMSIWIPRAAANLGPSSVKHLGLNTNPNIESRGNTNKLKISDEDLARAHDAADKMKIA